MTPASQASPASRSSGSSAAVLTAVFLLALGLRLAYVMAFRSSPFFQNLTVDSQWHDEWAWDWARGIWGNDGKAFFRAPVYPLWLAGIYAVFGHDLTALRVVQAVLGSLTAVFLAGAGIRWAGRAVGLAAGILAAGYGPMIFFDGEPLIPNLLLFLLCLALFLFAGRPGLRGLVLAGLCLGLAAAARPNALVLVPAAAFWVWRFPDAGPGVRRRRAAGVLALGVLPALAVSAVNTAREGAWAGVATQGGVNFYAGNHPGASGRSVEIPEFENLLSWRRFATRAETVAETETGRAMTSGEVSGWWFRRGFAWMAGNPGAAAGLYLKKSYYLVNAFEIPSNRDLYTDRRGPLRWLLWKSPVLAFPWGLFFPLALAGFAAAWRDPRYGRFARMLGWWFVLYALTILPFFVTARFRMGLLPPLILMAGFAVVYSPRWIRSPAAAVFVVAFLLCNSGFAEVRADNPGQERTRLAEALIREGRNNQAIEALEDSRRELPGDIIVAGLLAEAYMRESRPRDAIPLFQQVADARPSDPEPRFNLGVAYLQLEENEAAANVLETVVKLSPNDAAAWVNLGVASEGRNRLDRAEHAYSRGIALAPREELAYLNLARIRAGRRDWRSAAAVLASGAERIPASYDILYAMAVMSERSGDRETALRAVNRALAAAPGRTEAQELKQWLESRP